MFAELQLIISFLGVVLALPANYDGAKISEQPQVGRKNEIFDNVQNKVEQSQASKYKAISTALRTIGREEAREESEAKLSQLDSWYANVQKKSNEIFTQKPIVDTIQEHEKYGNDGGNHRKAAIAFVDFYEGIANAVNAFFEVPAAKAHGANENVREVIRFLGRSLVGL